MAELKTRETDSSVTAFIESVPSETKRKDAYILLELMEKITGHKAKMWGPSIIGFGSYHYKYESGHEGDAPLAGFSPRKAAISLYLSCDAQPLKELLSKLGKHKMGKGCLYINKLADVNMQVVEQLVKSSIKHTKKLYPS